MNKDLIRPLNYELRFSTLQRVEIAEMQQRAEALGVLDGFSTLQRVEIAEM